MSNPFVRRTRGARGMGDIFEDLWGGGGSGGGSINAGGGGSGVSGQIPYDAQLPTDAANLTRLGYPTASTTDPTDPDFKHSVSAFQSSEYPNAGPVDGKIGPLTRAWISAKLSGMAILPSPSPIPTPNTPASTTTTPAKSNLGLYAAIAAGIAGAWWMFGRKKKGGSK